jgi:hypothetical protein
MSIRRPWRRFLELSPHQRLLVLEAAIRLTAARLAILAIPFPRIAKRLGRLNPPHPQSNPAPGRETDALEVAWAIDRAARILPFNLVCLPRALAGYRMLSRRGIPGRLHFGASRSQEKSSLNTHAWLDACGVEVTGYPEAHNCVELGYYAQ